MSASRFLETFLNLAPPGRGPRAEKETARPKPRRFAFVQRWPAYQWNWARTSVMFGLSDTSRSAPVLYLSCFTAT